MNRIDKNQNLKVLNDSLYGFWGSDTRSMDQIISADKAEIEWLGFTIEVLLSRMKEITAAAKIGLGAWVNINDKTESMVEEAKGITGCPLENDVNLDKRVTIVKDKQTGKIIGWSDLNLHLIAKHSFFEGKGSMYRVEPKEVIKMIF